MGQNRHQAMDGEAGSSGSHGKKRNPRVYFFHCCQLAEIWKETGDGRDWSDCGEQLFSRLLDSLQYHSISITK